MVIGRGDEEVEISEGGGRGNISGPVFQEFVQARRRNGRAGDIRRGGRRMDEEKLAIRKKRRQKVSMDIGELDERLLNEIIAGVRVEKSEVRRRRGRDSPEQIIGNGFDIIIQPTTV